MNSGRDSKSIPTEPTAASKLSVASDNKNAAQAENNLNMKLITTSARSVQTLPVEHYNFLGFKELPPILQYLCMAYAGYLSAEEYLKCQGDMRITATSTAFFTPHFTQLQQQLEQAANDLLHDGKIDAALALIKEKPSVINIKTKGKDRLGRRIEGRTLLQMAAMAGDVNLHAIKAGEEDHGAVELFAQAANLTQAEVAAQLSPVIFSDEAKKANETRKKRIFAVIQEFGESISKIKTEPLKKEYMIETEEFKAAQAKCQPEIDKLRKDLIQIVSNEVITSGYIFDTHIYDAFNKWYKVFSKPFEGKTTPWHTTGPSIINNLIWVFGNGSLQYVAAARDAHIYLNGIHSLIEDAEIPPRTLTDSKGSTYFSTCSRLGLDFSLYYYRGGQMIASLYFKFELTDSETLCRAKTTALQNLCNDPIHNQRPAV